MAEKERKEKVHHIARGRAKIVKTKLEHSRPRSPIGCPVSYSYLRDEARAENRASRSLSDPVIPGNLVIYDKKGLFQKKNGGQGMNGNETTSGNSSAERPSFFEPSLQNKAEGVKDLKSQFELMTPFEMNTKPVDEFLNPLHKGNNAKRKSPSEIAKPAVEIVQTEDSAFVEPLNAIPEATTKYKDVHTANIPKKPQKPLPQLPVRSRGESDPSPANVSMSSNTAYHILPTIEDVSENNENELEQPEEEISSGSGWDDDSSFDSDSDWDSDINSGGNGGGDVESKPSPDLLPSGDQPMVSIYHILLQIIFHKTVLFICIILDLQNICI